MGITQLATVAVPEHMCVNAAHSPGGYFANIIRRINFPPLPPRPAFDTIRDIIVFGAMLFARVIATAFFEPHPACGVQLAAMELRRGARWAVVESPALRPDGAHLHASPHIIHRLRIALASWAMIMIMFCAMPIMGVQMSTTDISATPLATPCVTVGPSVGTILGQAVAAGMGIAPAEPNCEANAV